MGIVGVMRLTKNMPRKLTEANVYSREGGSVYQDGVTVMSKQEYMAMVKKMTDLEEKCKFMEAQAAFSLEREKILDAALRRVDQLELHLSETKKVKLSLSFTSLLLCLLCFVWLFCFKKLGIGRDDDEATWDDGFHREEKEEEEEG